MMSYKPIYVDVSYPADLRIRGGHPGTIGCPTIQEAVIAFRQMTPEQQLLTTIAVHSGPLAGRVFKPEEIERLHYGSKPD